jgi:hypothetical protein
MSAFNAYHYIALGCAAVVLSIIGALTIFVRSLSKRGASKRAVERLRNLPHGEPLAPLPAASPEMLLPISGEVPPTLEHTEPLEVQPTVNVSQTVSPAVQPTLERAEPLEVEQVARAEVPLPANPIVEPILQRAGPLAVQPVVRTEAPQPVGAQVRPILERAEPLEVQPAATRPELPLPVGSKVWAVCKFGSVPKGTPGIVTGIADGRFIWQSPMYLCTFADNRKVRARPKDIEAHNHAHSLQELEQPNLGAIQSRRMILRAQQIQRPTHRPFVGKTKAPNEIAEVNT